MRSGAEKPTNNSRAEEVRRRRTQRSQERISSVSSRVTNPAPHRPVTVRSNTAARSSAFVTPIHQQVKTRARRQFYLTMDRTAGTELRLPAIPVIHPGWRLLSGLIAILTALGIFSLFNSPFCQVQSVEVKGLERLPSTEVSAMLNLENMSIVEIDTAQVMEKITSTYPDLINVHVSVDLPNAVSVTAEERKPVMAYKKGSAGSEGAGIAWVDASGVLFPARGDAGPLLTIYSDDDPPLAPLPLDQAQLAARDAAGSDAGSNNATTANGVSASDNTQPAKKSVPVTGLRELDPSLMAAAQGLSAKLPPETKLVYSKDHGLGWTDPQGWQVYIGRDMSEFAQKYNMYQHIASKLANDGVKPTLVSVEHLDAPFYRPEQ